MAEKDLAHYSRSLEKFEPNFIEMSNKSEEMVVETEADMESVSDYIASAKSLESQIEKNRVAVYDDLYPKKNRAIVKEVNALAKGYKARLKIIVKTLEGKYFKCKRALELKAAEAAAATAKKAEEEKARVEKSNAFIPPSMQKKLDESIKARHEEPKAQAPANVSAGKISHSHERSKKTYKIVDFSKVPDEFKVINEKALKAKGIWHEKDIPGIEWTKESVLATSLKK